MVESGVYKIENTSNGKLLKIYDSISDAARENGVHRGNITFCCKGKNHVKTVGGFKWSYYE